MILVVEEDRLVAQDIALAIRREGARVAGPAATPAEALRLLAEGPGVDLAVLEMGFHGQGGLAVAEALEARGVPFAFATGCAPEDLPPRFRDRPHWDKPFDTEALARFLLGLAPPAAERPG